jgi:hypothetical protein
MKPLLFILTLLVASAGFSQTYRPFLVDGAHWTIEENTCVGGPCDPGDPNNPANYFYTNEIHLKIDGDTIVMGDNYKKLVQNTNISGRPGPYQPGYYPCNTLGILWEDTIARKVFMRKVNRPYAFSWCAEDSILFDFSKQTGDTMAWDYSYCTDSLLKVDSVSFSSLPNIPFTIVGLDSTYYPIKTWNMPMDGYYAGFRLYESIGATVGFWGNSPSFEGSYQSTLTEYCIGTDSLCGFTCRLPLSISEISPPQVFISLYPDPAKDILNIQLTNINLADKTEFIIMNLLGQEIHWETITMLKTLVNVSALPSGIYLWHFVTTDKPVRSGKFVHQ